MRLTIRLQGIEPSAPLRQYAQRRTYAALSKFGSQVTKVDVRFADVNGPKGGIDSRCDVHVHGPRIGKLTVRELTTDGYVAVTLGMARMARLIGRRLDRLGNYRPRIPRSSIGL